MNPLLQNNSNYEYEFETISELFLNVCRTFGSSKSAFMYKDKGDKDYRTMDFIELKDKVECLALGLLNSGIRAGDRIGIVSENRIEWILADLAISCIGAVDVPIFPILTSKQEEYIFEDCQVQAIIVSNDFQLGKVMQFKEKLSSLRHVIVMNKEFQSQDLGVKSLDYLMSMGAERCTPEERSMIFEEACRKVNKDDLLTLIYTSGTTGNPKGVMLSHGNVVANIKGSVKIIHITSGDYILSYLPLCHSYERTTGYLAMFSKGATIALAESIDTVSANLLEIRPTIMTTVPRFLDTVRKKIFNSMEKEPASKRKIFNWAVNVGSSYIWSRQEGRNPVLKKAEYLIADKLVFIKIREKMGGRLKLLVSGGAAIQSDTWAFFLAAGIDLLQGYGLTEASPVVSCTTPHDNEIGSIGKPLHNCEVRLAEDGEILVKGPNVMKGYWNDKAATDAAIDPEGWLYTGDVGVWTDKGNIKITDRKKNIFVSSGGKNIAPQPIESLLQQSKYIEHVILIGDHREFITALITPDFQKLEDLAAEFGIQYTNVSELISNEKILNHVKKDIDYLQRDLAKYERVRKIRLLSAPFTIENGELSPKLSIKRHIVEKKYAEFIEAMYSEK